MYVNVEVNARMLLLCVSTGALSGQTAANMMFKDAVCKKSV